MKSKLDQVVKTVVRYKDKACSQPTLILSASNLCQIEVLRTLTDGQTSVQQNQSIERLTYLTIVYLPIGLMAVCISYKDRTVY